MAAMVEDARWRTSAKGRRFLTATLSDSSGQFQATAFDDEAIEALQKAAETGACGLVTAELDRRAGDETARVAIKRFQPIEALAKRTRLQMIVRAAPEHVSLLCSALPQGGGNGVVRLVLPLAGGGEANLLLGREFVLDADLAARIERITGEGSVELSPLDPPKLALVG
jgi:DNA polymerase-3 subunit alpha